MSPYPSPSASVSASPTPSSTRSTISTDVRLRSAIIVLSILAGILMVYVIYVTLCVKRRRKDGEKQGPYQGTVMYADHPAAQISPFGSNSRVGPKFKHTPGEDMRIAIRRPDGAWHFTDSRTPFTPSGVHDLVPSPISPSSASILSLSSAQSRLPSRKAQEVKMESLRRRYDPDLDFEDHLTTPPPPAYHPEGHREDKVGHSPI